MLDNLKKQPRRSQGFGIAAAVLGTCLLSGLQAQAFQVGVDLNTYKQAYGTTAATFGLLKCDFVYDITVNSDLTNAQFQTAFTTLQGNNDWIVSEDNPPNVAATPPYYDNRSYAKILSIMGYVADRMNYNETGATPGGTLLSDSEIAGEIGTHGGQTAVLTRDYSTRFAGWRSETDRCIADPRVTAVVMETANDYGLQDCDGLVPAVLKAGKRVYFLLPATNTAYTVASINYLISKQPALMASPNVYVVVYNYTSGSTAATTWFGGTNTSQGTVAQCLQLEQSSDAQVSGTVALQGSASMDQPLTFTLTPTGTTPGNPFTLSGTPSASGAFSIAVPAGTYTLGVKGSKWLRKDAAINTTSGNISGMSFSLTAGDVNNDNVVNGADISAISAAFRSHAGDTNWNPNCDLNDDGVVNGADYSIASANFRKSGDP